jgi:ABC-type sugar transport system substrate-binding protein
LKLRTGIASAILLIVMFTVALAASSAQARPQAKTIKIAMILKFPVDYFFTLQKSAQAWAKTQKGVKISYAYGKAANDDAGEIAAIQAAVAKGVKGIAITPTGPAVIPALNAAVKKRVKVVLIDNDLPTWHGKTSVVATNNFNGGVLAGQYLAKVLKPGDKLGLLAGVPGVPALDDRINGALKGLGALKDQLKIVPNSTGAETDCDQAKGAAAAQTLLTANPDMKAIYSACGPPALGAIQSAKNAHWNGMIVGFDGLPDEVAAIKAGDETASVAQHPKLMGSLGPATLVKAIKGKKVPKNVDTGTALVTG